MHAAGERTTAQVVEAAEHGAVVERHHRVAVRRLVARRDERVERERVVVGRDELFLDQRPEDAHGGGV